MTFPFGEPITIRKRGLPKTKNSYGDDVYTTTTETVIGAWVPPQPASETDARALTQPSVYLPPDVTDVNWVDAVQRGDSWDDNAPTYEVDGQPSVWGPNPFTGSNFGVEVRLKTEIRPPA